MLSKCANPNCITRFLYLGKGTLFLLEKSSDPEPPADGEASTTMRQKMHGLETFWLCENRFSRLVVRMIRGTVEVIPRGDVTNHVTNQPRQRWILRRELGFGQFERG